MKTSSHIRSLLLLSNGQKKFFLILALALCTAVFAFSQTVEIRKDAKVRKDIYVKQGECKINPAFIMYAAEGREFHFYTGNAIEEPQIFWSFGDGGTSTLAKPDHVYRNAGIYEVRLTLTAECGLSETFIKKILVK